MEHNYDELPSYWIYNNNTIIIKSHINEEIDFTDEIKSLIFSNFKYINDVIEIQINRDYKDKDFFTKFKQKGKDFYIKSKFNQSIDNLFPEILNLTLGYEFNKPVDNLPQNLQNLIFGHCFNCMVDNLPQSLQNLIFGCCFNCMVDIVSPVKNGGF